MRQIIEGFRLSPQQERLWLLRQGNDVYRAYCALKIDGQLSIPTLLDAVRASCARHEIYRTSFSWSPQMELPIQVINAAPLSAWRHIDLRNCSPLDQQKLLLNINQEVLASPIDLEEGPFVQCTFLTLHEHTHSLFVCLHALYADTSTLDHFTQDIVHYYQDSLSSAVLDPEVAAYIQFSEWQHALLEGKEEATDDESGNGKNSAADSSLALPFERKRFELTDFSPALLELSISSDIYKHLETFLGHEPDSLPVFLLACWQILLWRLTNRDDLLLGLAVDGHIYPQLATIAGPLVKDMPFSGHLSEDLSFGKLLAQTNEIRQKLLSQYPSFSWKDLFNPPASPTISLVYPFAFDFREQVATYQVAETSFSLQQCYTHSEPFKVKLIPVRSGSSLHIELHYDATIFDRQDMQRLAYQFETLLESAVKQPKSRISDLNMLGAVEREQLLVELNQTQSDYLHDLCLLHERIEQQVERTPEAIAVLFEEQQLSYGELDARANRLASALQKRGVGPDVLVGVCLERSLELIVALLAILKAGGAYVPFDLATPAERLAALVADAGVHVVLTNSSVTPLFDASTLPTLHILDMQEQTSFSAGAPSTGQVQLEHLAYMIYTSGSTGKPKGVMNTHRGISNRLLWMQQAYHLTMQDRVLQKTPLSFDVSVWELFWPLLNGATLVVAEPGGHQDPRYLAMLIQQQSITTLHFVPTMLQAFLEEPALGSACGSLRQVICSGEALSIDLHDRFFARMPEHVHLANLYGPTEAAVDVTSWSCVPGERSVPIGRPIANTQIYLLDEEWQPVPIGVGGELYIGGVNLARGYHGRADLTGERFVPDPYGEEPGSRLYRTGDLARYRADGAIEYLGRLDFQIKLRGIRIELGEIEEVLRGHPAVQEAVVVLREKMDEEKFLVAYVQAMPGTHSSREELRGWLSQQVPAYMVPTNVILLDVLPLTPNGKLDRRALPTPDQLPLHDAAIIGPRTPLEEVVLLIWADLLHLSPSQLSIHDNFFALGGHSLLATRMIARLRQSVQVDLPLRRFFDAPTIADLVPQIEELLRWNQQAVPSIQLTPRNQALLLSFAQERLWFLQQLEPQSTAYHVPIALGLRGPFSVAALEQSLQELIERHESLRTTFSAQQGRPVQVIARTLLMPVPVIDLGMLSQAEQAEQMRRLQLQVIQYPFDLARGPLLRLYLLRQEEHEQVLLINLHHIVTDGWSMGVLVRELSTLYQAQAQGLSSELPDLPIQYADYALWQRQWLQGEALEQQLAYWKRQLSGAPTLLDLPTDHPRSQAHTFAGAHYTHLLPLQLLQQLRQLSQQEGVTLFMTLLAAFQVLLMRYSGQSDIVVGSAIANRTQKEMEGLIGFFVNTLALRTDLTSNPSFQQLLYRVREVCLGAYAHQDVPFEYVVEVMAPARDPNRSGSSPLFQVTFALQNAPQEPDYLDGVHVRQLDLEHETSKFDLSLFTTETEQGLKATFEYNTALFEAETIIGLLNHWQVLLSVLVEHPAQRITELPLLTLEEHALLLGPEAEAIAVSAPSFCLHELFEQQVERTPDVLALVYHEQQLSYSELNDRANQLARWLRQQGVGPDVLVGVALPRSPELLVSLLGILKAGGGYVPLDLNSPAERLAYLIQSAHLSMILTREEEQTQLPVDLTRLICWEAIWPVVSRLAMDNLVSSAVPENVAYLISTSGSTGRPKGVLSSHAGIANLAREQQRCFGVQPGDHLLQEASLSFDASVFEIVLALLSGATLSLPDAHTYLFGDELFQLLALSGIQTVVLTPSALSSVPSTELPALRTIVVAGEPCPLALMQLWAPGRRFFNAYGPTEATIWTTVAVCTPEHARITIGRSLAQTQVVLLDHSGQPLPTGVVGELYIGGVSLARGYLDQAAETAERFVPHPWSQVPGARLYRTGDLARFLPDGTLEYLGRVDQQVKLRGFRVELGEIETTLRTSLEVQDAVVLAREDRPGDIRLVAYLVFQRRQVEATIPTIQAPLLSERVDHWQQMYDDLYQQTPAQSVQTFNVVGWNSSYTGQPIAVEEMQAWQEDILALVRASQPQRIWEIGCGTGLLLFPLSATCVHYYGSDFSASVLAGVRHQLDLLEQEHGVSRAVTLFQRSADDFSAAPAEPIDTVLINSVVQYFPSADYLLRVLDGALDLLAPGGRIIVGDVRSLPLLEAFHASVQLAYASGTQSALHLRQQVQQQLRQEQELVLHPAFFRHWAQASGRVQRIEVRLKRGWAQNELMQFRYQVVMHVGEPQVGGDAEPGRAAIAEFDWSEQGLTHERIRQQLQQEQPSRLRLRQIPNARVEQAVQTVQWLASALPSATVDQWRATVQTRATMGIEPEALWELVDALGYQVSISWEQHGTEGCYQALLQRRDGDIWLDEEELVFSAPPGHTVRDWQQRYANQPLQREVEQRLLSQIRASLEAWLPEYMVPAHLVVLDALPLTANGKLDRQALPAPEHRVRHDDVVIRPRTPLEELISMIWADLLQLSSSQLSIDDDFFALGGHSLLATRVISRLRQSVQVEVPLRLLFEAPTIVALAGQIERLRQGGDQPAAPALVPIVRDQSLPLSFAQERLWFLQQLGPESTVYHVPVALRLRGPLSVVALEQSLQALIERHESLRTTFVSHQDRPVQIIAATLHLSISVINVEVLLQAERDQQINLLLQQAVRQPFDLASGPLLRLLLLRLKAHEHVLLVNLHHIVTDGWSMGVLVRELSTLYQSQVQGLSSELPVVPIQYADYALWQRQWLQGDVLERQLTYWKQQLAGAPTMLTLPTDHARPPIQTFAGARHVHLLAPELLQQLYQLSQEEGVTLFMTLLAAFQVLLLRYSGQSDIVVGTPIANRTRAETEGIIGFFVNTLALRGDLSSHPSFRELLGRVREVTLQAYAHQDVPFEQLVEALHVERSLSRTPLFQVLFALQNTPDTSLELAGLSWESVALEQVTTKFDLTFSLDERASGLYTVVSYKTDLFEAATIARLLNHWQELLAAIIKQPEQSVALLPLLTQEEYQFLLPGNQPPGVYRSAQCLPELLEQQVERNPAAVAVVFAEQQLTYRALNSYANQLAHLLRQRGIGPEVSVGICLPPSLELVIAVLAVLKAGGMYLPLDSSYPRERLALMLQDAQTSLVLTHSMLLESLSLPTEECLCLDQQWSKLQEASSSNPQSLVVTTNAAYLLYTSGSTGQPKGVVVEHRALLNYVLASSERAKLEAGVYAMLQPLTVDSCLTMLFPALLTGGVLQLFSKEETLDARTLARSFAHAPADYLKIAPSHLAALLSEETAGEVLPRRTLIIGGEASSWEWSLQVRARMAQGTVFNHYGPTETTVGSLMYPIELPPDKLHAAITLLGTPLAQTQVYVLDEYCQMVPVGVVGELYIGGAGLARGYQGKPEITAERFIPHPFGQEPGARLYRSGDLVRMRIDGMLEFMGRRDEQVKIRGNRIELGEIEVALRRHSGLSEAVVIVQEVSLADKQLVAYLVAQQGEISSLELQQFLQHTLPTYMIPSIFVWLDALPLTPHGKLDRRALPAPDLAVQHTGVVIGPRTPLEEVISMIWTNLLHLSSSQLSIYDNFFALGGHSLLATQVISRLRLRVSIDMPLRLLFEAPTIATLAPQIEMLLQGSAQPLAPTIKPISRNLVLPLSFGQERLWFLQQLEPLNTAYHIPVALRLHGLFAVAALEHSLQTLIERHESLRTTFVIHDEQPIQVIADAMPMTVPVIDIGALSQPERDQQIHRLLQQAVQQPFDLVHGPLLRLLLLRLHESENVLLMNMHHIVTDGWSMGVLVRELSTLYQAQVQETASELPAMPIQYADYALWQRQWLQGDVLERQLTYWKQQLAGAPALLELPTDHPRPAMQTFAGSHRMRLLAPHVQQQLQHLSQQEGVTLFMTLLAAFQVLLLRYSGQTDLVVGTPIANRTRAETEDVIGLFINTLVLRVDLAGNPSFRELLARVREVTLQAYAHQDLPFEQLMETLPVERSLSYTPLFQVLFVLQNTPRTALDMSGLTWEALEMEQATTKFDLSLLLQERAHGLQVQIEYNTALFASATIERLLDHWQVLLDALIARPGQSIATLPLLTQAEHEQLLVQWNQTNSELAPPLLLHERIEQQVERTPEAIAVLFEEQQLSYGELDARANRLASALQKRGVGPDVLVGVCLERSLELIVALLAILKAGGAYVPFDLATPAERLAALVADAGVHVVLTDPSITPLFDVSALSTLHIINVQEEASFPAGAPSTGQVQLEHLAYMIYTSGSTGKPKGVMNTHRGISNRLLWMQQAYHLTMQDRVLQKTPLSFDVSVWELFWPLLNGATLVVAEPGGHQDSRYLAMLIQQQSITTLHFVPTMLQAFLEEPALGSACGSLRQVICSGEALSIDLHDRFFARMPEHVHLANLYGPTEAAVDVASWPCVPGERSVPIGRPIANTQIYLLDEEWQPVPIGVAGELYIGGVNLARGYHGRADLTGERFVPDPYGEEAGSRLYRTGDLARYRADGAIEYLGRLDFQVKLRGIRIELGEIEEVLRGHPAVQEAVVVLREEMDEEKFLVAYVVAQLDTSPTHEELRRWLGRQVPGYMVPTRMVLLEALPLTSNGKLDRRALPAPDQSVQHDSMMMIGPRTPLEEQISIIWADLLHLPPSQLSIHDNFFMLGGHSLLATRVIARLRQSVQVDLPLRRFFEAPTIAEMAQIIEQKRGELLAQVDDDELDQMLRALEELSDDDIHSMLNDEL